MRFARFARVSPAALLLLTGCLAPGSGSTARDRLIAAAARPLLTLDPNATWTTAYNELVAFGPASIAYLMCQPALTQPAPPDDLGVLLHTSLVRLLADPATRPPHLSATCFETTHGLVYFDLKASRRSLGTARLDADALPRDWPGLYPGAFNHAAAAQIDVEADRRALCQWWQAQRGSVPTARPLTPTVARLWPLLARRRADRWEDQPETGGVLCSSPPRSAALFDLPTCDYNLVRAACIWLGQSADAGVVEQLIDLVGSPHPNVAYNARFALRYSRDPRIRAAVGGS
jgi:hypothetical protein